MTVDMVNHPPHYQNHPIFTGECHDYTSRMSFDQGNGFKYLWRYEGKNGTEDVNKARWYVNAASYAVKLPDIVIERMEEQRNAYVAAMSSGDQPATVADLDRVVAADAMICLAHGDIVAAYRVLNK